MTGESELPGLDIQAIDPESDYRSDHREGRLRFGEFLFDADAETLRGPAGEIRLRPQVFELLGLLLREAPKPVSQQRLIDEVWGLTHVSASSIQRTISELRSALGDDARAPRYVETVHRRGYRFVAAIEPVSVEPPRRAGVRRAADRGAARGRPVRPRIGSSAARGCSFARLSGPRVAQSPRPGP